MSSKCSQALQKEMAKRLVEFIRDRPDEPLLAGYPYPANEFSVAPSNHGWINIYHPLLGWLTLTT